jgi:hypothetical protein
VLLLKRGDLRSGQLARPLLDLGVDVDGGGTRRALVADRGRHVIGLRRVRSRRSWTAESLRSWWRTCRHSAARVDLRPLLEPRVALGLRLALVELEELAAGLLVEVELRRLLVEGAGEPFVGELLRQLLHGERRLLGRRRRTSDLVTASLHGRLAAVLTRLRGDAIHLVLFEGALGGVTFRSAECPTSHRRLAPLVDAAARAAAALVLRGPCRTSVDHRVERAHRRHRSGKRESRELGSSSWSAVHPRMPGCCNEGPSSRGSLVLCDRSRFAGRVTFASRRRRPTRGPSRS